MLDKRINWKGYHDHLIQMLHQQMNNPEFSDVTLICADNKRFKVHQLVLSACSPLFQEV